MPELKRLQTTRIVATPAALDALAILSGALALRTAADELLLMPSAAVELADEYAIVVEDGSFAGSWWNSADLLPILERTCEWELPIQRPAFAQGMIAGIPAKLWLEKDSILLMCPAVYAAEMEERIHE